MDRVNLLINHVNLKKGSNEGTKKMDFNLHDFLEHALKQVDPELCELLSNGYKGLLKLSSTLEEKAKQYEAETQDKRKKLEDLSIM